MKELTQQEIEMVSGAGIIKDTLSNVGSGIGGSLLGLIPNPGIEIPGLGNISFENIGKSLGASAGSFIGGAIESAIGSIPIVGGWLKGLLGN